MSKLAIAVAAAVSSAFLFESADAQTTRIQLNATVTGVTITGEATLTPNDVASIGDDLLFEFGFSDLTPIGAEVVLDELLLTVNGLTFEGTSPRFDIVAGDLLLQSEVGGTGGLAGGFSLFSGCCGSTTELSSRSTTDLSTASGILDYLVLLDGLTGFVVGEATGPLGEVVGVTIDYELTPVPLPGATILYGTGMALLIRRKIRIAA